MKCLKQLICIENVYRRIWYRIIVEEIVNWSLYLYYPSRYYWNEIVMEVLQIFNDL